MPSNKQSQIDIYGSEEAYKEHMARIGAMGGKKSTGKTGFALWDKKKLKAMTSRKRK